ncbi:MAG: glutathione synthase [Gammaproteobacteria bacterium]|nr:MAG: glutathione synthase [Gammaproteobacteria bacterium]
MTTLAVVMDPLGSVNIKKDSTLAMLLEAQKRGWVIQYIEQRDLILLDGKAKAYMRHLKLDMDQAQWFDLGDPTLKELNTVDVVLMRKDPPFDMEYIYCTYLLELAEAEGTLVVNKPGSLRDANEKLFTAWFPQCTPPTLVSRLPEQIREFHRDNRDIILKPLDGMGGASIFRIRESDPNTNVIIETLTNHGSRFAMAQKFIPEISKGDKRILMIDGEPVPYALARIPAAGETRGNLAAGGKGVGVELDDRDKWICNEVGQTLRERGLVFAGLDVIGDYLTEINVTSPTCIRELDSIYQLNISARLLDTIAAKLS